MNEVEEQVEFLEQVTNHLHEGVFDGSSKDPLDRRMLEMVNLIETRQLVLGQLGTTPKSNEDSPLEFENQ